MGCDKALIEIDGVPMAVRVADALRSAGAAEVFAVGGDEPALAGLGLLTWPDDRPGGGPLPATITALRAATEDLVMVMSCDLLQPSPTAIAHTVAALTEHPGAIGAVPVVDEHRQWTHAAWRALAVRALVAAYERGSRSLRRAGMDLLVFEVEDIEAAAVADADEPGDLPTADGGPQRER